MKVCTKCGVKKEIYEFSKDAGQKSGLRPDCKECRELVSKKYRTSEKGLNASRIGTAKWRKIHPERYKESCKKQAQRPQRKQAHKMRMANWRKENPQVQKERANKSYRKNFLRNRDKKNEKNRERWRNETFRNDCLKKAADRYLLNRKLFCKCCNKELPKYSIKYCDDCRDEKYRQIQFKWKERVGKDYLNELQNKRVKRKVAELSDGYIAGQIRGNNFPGWKKEEMPTVLIELKRNVIKLKRELKNIKQ